MDRTLNIIQMLIGGQKVLLNPESVARGYSHTSKEAPLRKFLCHAFVHLLLAGREGVHIQSFQEVLANQPDLAQDIVPLLAGAMGKVIPFSDKPDCKYHAHPKIDVCPWKPVARRKKRKAAPEE